MTEPTRDELKAAAERWRANDYDEFTFLLVALQDADDGGLVSPARTVLGKAIAAARAQQQVDSLIDEPIRLTMGQAAGEIARLRAENEKLKGNCRGMSCPFCGEDNFDAVGLKWHIAHEACEQCESLGAPRPRFF